MRGWTRGDFGETDNLSGFPVYAGMDPVQALRIDAPESHQAFGQKSKTNLAAMVFNRDVVAECGKQDKYRRDVCVIKVDGKDANEAQVAAGMAWWYRNYAREQTTQQRADYVAAEFNAKIRRLGLWADKSPVPPGEWRHQPR